MSSGILFVLFRGCFGLLKFNVISSEGFLCKLFSMAGNQTKWNSMGILQNFRNYYFLNVAFQQSLRKLIILS